MHALLDRPLWVFDMDGTLTVPAHDFAAFKAKHGLPADRDLLGATLALPEPRRREVLDAIDVWEDAIARAAQAQDDAVALLDALVEQGARCAVLTRNSREGAFITLEAAGLLPYFVDQDLILGRDCALAKPAPDGVLEVLRRAGSTPAEAVMVGDWVFDVMAGRNAGTATVLVERHGPAPEDWRSWCDVRVERLDVLIS